MTRYRDRNSRTSIASRNASSRPRLFPGTCAVAGGLLLWTAFAPLGWTWCAWVAPIPWLLLVRDVEPLSRRDYGKLYLAGVLFWLAMLQGIRLAHPANYLGLLALALYLAVYLPAFVGLVWRAVHAARAPLWLAAPVIWTGLELVRGYLFTGFSIGLLGHTQSSQLWLIQTSDLLGAYGVSWTVMLVAACLVELASAIGSRRSWRPAAVAASVLAIAGGYGTWRLQQDPDRSDKPLRVALLQGTRDKVFETNPRLERESFQQYFDLMVQAGEAESNLDLVVWPEAAFTEMVPEVVIEQPVEPPPGSGWTAEETRQRIAATQQVFTEKLRDTVAAANRSGRTGRHQNGQVHLLLGVTSLALRGSETHQYNSALAIDPDGEIMARYHKMHLVMFGEYVPFARVLPWLARLTPIGAGLSAGAEPMVVDVRGYRLMPGICFESTVPHLIRRQVRHVASETGTPPDLLVNISDDGWFFGSSILDLHLTCSVFRAVELRRPVLVASNTGISAVINGNGRIEQRLPHQSQGRFLIASASPDGRFSGYLLWGDAFAAICLAVSLMWLFRGWYVGRTRVDTSPQGPGPSPA